jgi:hypothetical protein
VALRTGLAAGVPLSKGVFRYNGYCRDQQLREGPRTAGRVTGRRPSDRSMVAGCPGGCSPVEVSSGSRCFRCRGAECRCRVAVGRGRRRAHRPFRRKTRMDAGFSASPSVRRAGGRVPAACLELRFRNVPKTSEPRRDGRSLGRSRTGSGRADLPRARIGAGARQSGVESPEQVGRTSRTCATVAHSGVETCGVDVPGGGAGVVGRGRGEREASERGFSRLQRDFRSACPPDPDERGASTRPPNGSAGEGCGTDAAVVGRPGKRRETRVLPGRTPGCVARADSGEWARCPPMPRRIPARRRTEASGAVRPPG